VSILTTQWLRSERRSHLEGKEQNPMDFIPDFATPGEWTVLTSAFSYFTKKSLGHSKNIFIFEP